MATACSLAVVRLDQLLVPAHHHAHLLHQSLTLLLVDLRIGQHICHCAMQQASCCMRLQPANMVAMMVCSERLFHKLLGMVYVCC